MPGTIHFANNKSINSLLDRNQPSKKEKEYIRISRSVDIINPIKYKEYVVRNISLPRKYDRLSQSDLLDLLIFNFNYDNRNVINEDFSITLKRLFELQEEDPDIDEDDEIYYPSDYAFSGSLKLLYDLYLILGTSFPRGYASLDTRGGVNLIWKNHELDKQVWYKFSVDQSLLNTVYFRQGDESRLIKKPRTILVVKLLQWLITENTFAEICQLVNV
jgi:hypothetical protein